MNIKDSNIFNMEKSYLPFVALAMVQWTIADETDGGDDDDDDDGDDSYYDDYYDDYALTIAGNNN